MIVKLLTEHHLEFLSLKGGCRGSSESTLVKLLEISCRGSNLYCAGSKNANPDAKSLGISSWSILLSNVDN